MHAIFLNIYREGWETLNAKSVRTSIINYSVGDL